jgi:peptidoglycan hydrolase-like protein with peptidoglycan-binding domain
MSDIILLLGLSTIDMLVLYIMRRFIFAILSSLAVSSFAFSAFAADTFTSDLHMGITLPEVKLLQQVLNASSDTVVSVSGAGSKGQETEYFGVLTQAAVIRFQNKYRNEILVPAGLSSGTGFVGGYTRVVLNRLIVPAPAQATPIVPKASANPISAVYQNPYASSTFYLSTSSLDMLAPYLPSSFSAAGFYSTSTADRNSAFTAAYNAISTLLKSKYNIVLPDASTTAVAPVLTPMKVGTKPPVISIVEKPVNLSDTITLKGTGFTDSNSVYTSLGHLDHVVNDGSNLSFKLSDIPGFSFYSNIPRSYLAASTTVIIWVYNDNGMSNVLGPYSVNF